MPWKSQAQRKWMYAAEARGELPKGTSDSWAKETPNVEKLPERVGKKKNLLKHKKVKELAKKASVKRLPI